MEERTERVANRLLALKKQWLYKRQEKGKVFWIAPWEYKLLKRFLWDYLKDMGISGLMMPPLDKIYGHEIRLKYPLLTGG